MFSYNIYGGKVCFALADLEKIAKNDFFSPSFV
jgi:hypothetical protein